MNHLPTFFVNNISEYSHLSMTHNMYLVVLSVLVAIFSSTLALHTTQIVKLAKDKLQRHFTIAIGSLSLGLGIWCMHFIGILSMEMPITIRFNYVLTILSLIPSWVAAWIIFSIISRNNIHLWQLLLSGLLVGAGIGTMHYVGMSALVLDTKIRYDLPIFILSIIVAVAFSTLSLWIRFGLVQKKLDYLPLTLISGIIMGLAISAMHYVGMDATYFIGEPSPAPHPELELNTASLSILLATFAVSGSILITFIGSLIRFKQLFVKMKENESKTRAIVDTAVDGIITINGHGIVQSFNQSAERLFGWKADEIIGKNINNLMPEPYTSHHDGYLHNYLSTGKAKIIGSGREVEGLRKDGSILPMRLAVGRVQTEKEALFVGFVTDITERKKLEQSLRQTAEEAKKAASVKTAFLANMSHEIRTPLNAIIGFTDILLQTKLNTEQHQHLSTIQRSSKSLLSLLNDILDTTKLEKGSFELENIDFSLEDVAKQVAASLNLSAKSKGLRLNLEYNNQLAPYYQGDPLRIQQIITNLIGNAIKFTEQGYVTLRVYPETDTHHTVHIEVADTGIGMTKTQLQRIFESFVQADASISRRFGGTGLGTTISKQLVELMDGQIYVESVYGQGSTFHVLLPLATGKAPVQQLEEISHKTLPPLHVLIADDVPQNLELLTLILKNQSHTVTAASNGDEVLSLFKQHHYDLVLMDVHMPNKDGLATTKEIRHYEQLNQLAPTPIIALTASVMEADRQAARNAGMNGFTIKPIDPKKLFKEMARVLNICTLEENRTEQEKDPDNSIIDWKKGVALWGSQSNMIKAIQQFIGNVDQTYPLPQQQSDNIDWEQTRLCLHSIRGAAGNLCLTDVAASAAMLEDMVRKDELGLFFKELDHLKASIVLIKEMPELSTSVPEELPPDTANVSHQEIIQAVRRLTDCAMNNEIDDHALKLTDAYLRHHNKKDTLTALNHAYDQFDFDTAEKILISLQQELGQKEEA